MSARESLKTTLGKLGLLKAARIALGPSRILARKVSSVRRQGYYRTLVGQYRSRFAKPIESYLPYEQREREASVTRARARFETDRQAVLSFVAHRFALDLSSIEKVEATFCNRVVGRVSVAVAALAGWKGADDAFSVGRKIWEVMHNREGCEGVSSKLGTDAASSSGDVDCIAVARTIIDRVLEGNLAPRFYDYDYLEDIVGIVGGRYCSDNGADMEASAAILQALSLLGGGEERTDWPALPQRLRALLGAQHGYRPPRGDVTKHVWSVIPDMAEEFIELKAETNVARFLAINREYSRRQAVGHGLWDNREVSLLRGYERDHHLMLRTIVGLVADGQLSSDDEVLIIGPRHIDEVKFFRDQLGLPRTIGLDLFKYGKDEVLAGDMHDMPFEAGRFKLVFCAGTLSYSYNARRVVEEIARVSRRPGFVVLIDAAGRHSGPDALGRSDIVSIDTLIGLFYQHPFHVLAKDAGKTLAPEHYENEPCLAIRLDAAPAGWRAFPGGAALERSRQRS